MYYAALCALINYSITEATDTFTCCVPFFKQLSHSTSGGASYRQGRARPYHFHSGPTSGPTTRTGSKKSKIFVVHSLAVLKGHPECLKCGKTLWRPGLRPGPCSQTRSWLGGPLPKYPTPALGPSGLQPWLFGPRSLPSQICLPKSVHVVN